MSFLKGLGLITPTRIDLNPKQFLGIPPIIIIEGIYYELLLGYDQKPLLGWDNKPIYGVKNASN